MLLVEVTGVSEMVKESFSFCGQLENMWLLLLELADKRVSYHLRIFYKERKKMPLFQ